VKIGITCYPTYGGSGIVATELGLELANRGHEIHFISYANPIRLDTEQPRIHYHEVEVSTYPLFQFPPYDLALASRMAEVASLYSLDLLHVHYAIPHSISALLARDMMASSRRLPFITTLHGTDITLVARTGPTTHHQVFDRAIRRRDGRERRSAHPHVRRVSRQERHSRDPQLRELRDVLPSVRRPSADPYSPRGEKVLMHISNFRPVKRTQDCIHILEAVRKDVPAHLLMVGDGPERGPAEELARELGLERHVTFLGSRTTSSAFCPSPTRCCCRASWSRLGWWRWRQWPAGSRPWPRGSAGYRS